MSRPPFPRRAWWFGVVFCSVALLCGAAYAAERNIEARLIWGTNEDKSPNPSHKPLEGDIARKLRELPFKWKNYFEVNRQGFVINDKEYKKIVLSDKCYIEVKDKGDTKVTVKLYGDGKMAQRIDKPLPKDETLTIGGDAKGSNAWFITVRALTAEKKEAKPAAPPKPATAAHPAPKPATNAPAK